MDASRFFGSKRRHSEIEEDDCSDMPQPKRMNNGSQLYSVGGPPSSYQSEMACFNVLEAQQSPARMNGMGQVPPTSPPAGSVYPAFLPNGEAASTYSGMSSVVAAPNTHPSNVPFVLPPSPPEDTSDFSRLHYHVPQNIPLHIAQHHQYFQENHMFQAVPDSPQDDDVEMGVDFDDQHVLNSGYQPELGERENPHYYQINSLLFSVHCDRLRREGQQLGS